MPKIGEIILMASNSLPFLFKMTSLVLGCAAFPTASIAALDAAPDMSRYNIVWNTPSKDASGAMPIGNGDIAAGVYTIENGDLYLLLAKNDAYSYQGDLFKTGRVRVSLKPNPFQAGKPFCQTLDLPTGSIWIEADGTKIRVWADANRPVFHIEIQSPHEILVQAQPEFWQRFDHTPYNSIKTYSPGVVDGATPPRDVLREHANKLLWFYAVGDRSVYPDDLKFHGIASMAAQFADPFRFNTFGNLLECPQLALTNGVLAGQGKKFDLRIHALTMQTPDINQWIEAIEKLATQPVNTAKERENHLAWWNAFWSRSWIVTSDSTLPSAQREKFAGEAGTDGKRQEPDGAALVSQSYNVFRFLMACQSRGRVQVKFNGGLFTQPLRVDKERPFATPQPDGTWLTHEDDRLWGRRFTFQNQRLLYWPLLASGDFDLLQPFFNYYWNLLPVRQAITKTWFGHDGAYYRENIEPDGAERDCGQDGKPPRTAPGENKGDGYYHSYYFTCGLETTAMMADYVNFSGDKKFRDHVLTPFAREILRFYDRHYPRDSDGKLRLDPAQALETWWIAINPAPDIAGLRFVLDELLAMNTGDAADRAAWEKLRAELPAVPLQTIEGRPAIAPAEIFSKKKNAENAELYPVFPFRCFGLALGSADLVDWTMRHRTVKGAFGLSCWTQDQIHWACAGIAQEAADGLVQRFRTDSTMCRFPLYGKERPDSCPDFDHFGSGAVALQRMLAQEAPGKILLLPAWPAAWDVDFKLHLAGGAVISGVVKNGKLLHWEITPQSRKNEVIVCLPDRKSTRLNSSH